jgi:hypothetical protein
LGDYFSDNEEGDTWDRQDLTSESNLWSHTDFNKFEPNFTQSQTTLAEWDPVISGLETINEARFEDDSEADKLNHISGFSEETKLAFSTMTVYSSRTCLPKLCCSLAAVGLFIAGILITGAYPHPDLNDHNLNQTNATANGTNLTSTGNLTLAAESLAIIRANNEALYTHLDEISDQIEENIKQLQKRFSRSPRAMRTLEAAIAMFDQTHPEPEYQISEYATGKRQWK